MRIKKKNNTTGRRKLMRLGFVVGFFICFGFFLFVHTSRVLADTTTQIANIVPLPNSADIFVDPNNTTPTPNPVATGQPAMAVGDGSFNGNYGWIKVYVPVGQAATVTVQNGSGWCTNINDMLDAQQPQVVYTLEDLDNNEAEIAASGTYFQTMDSLAQGTQCQNLSFPTIQASQGTPSQITGHGSYRVFYLISHIINCPDSNINCTTQTKEFRAYASPGTATTYSFSTSGPLVGFSRAVSAATNTSNPFGIEYENLSQTYGTDVDFTYSLQFGTFCTESNSNAPLTFYDMDNGLANPQFLSADLYQSDKSQATLNWTLQQTYSANQIGDPGVNHSLKIVYFNAQPLYRYKLYVRRVNYDNATQLYIPYDQFDANNTSVACFGSTCSYTVTPSSGSLTVNNPYTIQVRMTNTGLASWDPNNYNLTQNGNSTTYLWSGGPPPPLIPTNGVATFNFTLNSFAAGTYEFDYQMRDPTAVGGNLFGETCKISLTWLNSYHYPYFKVYGGDVSTGGAFRRSDGSCNLGDYIAPSSGNQYAGGIRAFAYPAAGTGTPKGSSVDFGAYALGLIVGSQTNGDPPHGFYSDAQNPSSALAPTYAAFNFANQDVLGGLMGGGTPTASTHCAINYYSSTITSNTAPAQADTFTLDSASGQKAIVPPSGTLRINGTITSQLTLYVDGDVYITGDIKNNASGWSIDTNPTNPGFTNNNAPYFSLIVKGNIFIDPSAAVLDGFFVAQPKDDGSKGTFSTCAPGGAEASAIQITQSCHSQLVVNGAVVAKHVHLLRSWGDLKDATGNELTPTYIPDQINHQSAEIFNFVPSVVMGRPDFLPSPQDVNNKTGLPPLF